MRDEEFETRMFSIPRFSTRSSNRIDRIFARFSRMFAALSDLS